MNRRSTPRAFLPYLLLIIHLLDTLCGLSPDMVAFGKTTLFTTLVLDLASVLDVLDAQLASSKRSHPNLRIERIEALRLRELLDALPSLRPAILNILLQQSNVNATRSYVLLKHIIQHALRKTSIRSTAVNGDIASKSSNDIEARKDEIMTFYSTHILSSKVAVPTYRSTALSTFLNHYLDLPTLKDKLLPIVERMLLRSPEIALPILSSLITSNDLDVSSALPGKVLPAILSASKSSNADTRSKSVSAFHSLVTHRLGSEDVLLAMVNEVLALPKTAKTASAEHRTALYEMLVDVKPSDPISTYILDTSIPLVGKETNEAVLHAMISALTPHLRHIMTSSVTLSATTTSALSKELNSSRLPVRRALSEIIGDSLWSLPPSAALSPSGQDLVGELAPALEANLQTASSNLPTITSGFLEGFVVIALALGPLAEVSSAKKLTSSGLVAAACSTLAPKPSFMLNERVYPKLATGGDVTWFQRCLEVITVRQAAKLDAQVRRLVDPLKHLCVG